MKRLNIFERIHWRIVIIYLLLILIAMQVISAYFNQELEAHYVNDFTSMLDQQASLLAYSIQNDKESSMEEGEGEGEELGSLPGIHGLIDQMLTSIPQAEVQVLDANGVVVHTSSENQAVIGQENTQIEVKRALSGTRDDTIRINPQNGHRTQILSLPIQIDDEVQGAVYLAASMEDMYDTIRDINLILATGTFIALVCTALIGIVLARTITSPIKEMTRQTTAMAEGDFSRRVKVYGNDEIGRLSQGINELSRRLHQALSDNEEERNKLASILFYMSDGVIASDRQGRVMLMNQKAEEMLDRRESDVLGTKLSDCLSFPDHVQQDSLFEKSEQFLMSLDHEGDKLILQVKVTPLHGHEEDIQGVIAVLQDVTRQQQLERERKEFVANVSHELRTPLTTMKSYVEALNDGAKQDAQLVDKFLKVIQNETERMIRLVHDLLQLSKLDMRKLPTHKDETDMQRLVQEVVDRFSMSLKERDLFLELSMEEELPPLKVDRDQVIQVLDNILANAVKYSHSGGTIRVSVHQETEDMLIDIRDEGIGIPKAELKHIFKRFYRVEKARSREMGGSGLGLAITKEMIEAHRGRIEIDSDLGQGTRVRIRLPIVDLREGVQS